MDIAYWEKDVLWSETKNVDFGIALGTGARKTSIFKHGPQSPVRTGCVSRLLEAFLDSFDGEQEYIRFCNSLPKDIRHRFHRLNIPLQDKEPSIDDIEAIGDLEHSTEAFMQANPTNLVHVFDYIYASLFIFELDGMPDYVDGAYHCSGTMFCRLKQTEADRAYLYAWLTKHSAYFLVNGRPTVCCRRIPLGNPPFRCPLVFTVEKLDSVVGISVRGVTSRPMLISGFPQTVAQIIESQMLDCPFGRADHRYDKVLPCIPSKRRTEETTALGVTKRVAGAFGHV